MYELHVATNTIDLARIIDRVNENGDTIISTVTCGTKMYVITKKKLTKTSTPSITTKEKKDVL